MNRLVLSSAMVMAFGTVFGTGLILDNHLTTSKSREPVQSSASLPTSNQIAAWKATATTTDYIPPAPPR